MMQGDSYGLKIEILNAAGEAVTPDDVSDVEITVGFVRKTHADFDIFYMDGFWIFPLNQGYYSLFFFQSLYLIIAVAIDTIVITSPTAEP